MSRAASPALAMLLALACPGAPRAAEAEQPQATYRESFSTPQWLPDGRRVAFVRSWSREFIQYLLFDARQIIQHRVEVVLLDVDSAEQKPLHRWDRAEQVLLRVSPAGGRIAYSGSDGLYIQDAAAREETRIADGASALEWTPDGQALVFRPARGDPAVLLHHLPDGRTIELVKAQQGCSFFLSTGGDIIVEGPAIAQAFGSDSKRKSVLSWTELAEAAARGRASPRYLPPGVLSFSPDGRRGVAILGHKLYLRDGTSTKEVATFDERAGLSESEQRFLKLFLDAPTSPEAIFAGRPKGEPATTVPIRILPLTGSGSGTPPDRSIAADVLRLAGPRGVAAAAAALDSSDESAQALAGDALGELVGERDQAAIERAMLHPKARVRHAFLGGLLHRDPAIFAATLNRLIQHQFDIKKEWPKLEAQRDFMEYALRGSPPVLTAETLRAALKHNMSPIRSSAAHAMANSRDPQFVPDLRDVLANGPDWAQRDAALALLCLGWDGGAPLLYAQLEEPRKAYFMLLPVSIALRDPLDSDWVCPLLLRFLDSSVKRQFAPSRDIAFARLALFRITGHFLGPVPEGWIGDTDKPQPPPTPEELAEWQRWWDANRDRRPSQRYLAALLSPGPHPRDLQACLLPNLKRTVDPEDAPLLKQLLQSQDLELRSFARRTLEYFEAGGRPAPSRPRQTEKAEAPDLAPLLAALRSKDPKVWESAARKLGEIKDPAALAPLLAAAKEPDPLVQRAAVRALLRMGRPAAEAVIAPIRARRSSEGKPPEPPPEDDSEAGILEALAAALEDEQPGVRDTAAWALAQTKDPRAIGHLISALRDPDEKVRETAVLGFEGVKDPRIVEPLVAALDDPSYEVRSRAAQWLGGLGDRRAVLPLIEKLKARDPRDRLGPLSALARLKDPASTEALVAVLKDSSQMVRESAAWALEELADPRSADALLAALKDSSYYVRKCAAEALGHIGDKRAVEPLITLLGDKSPDVRGGAARALGELGDPRAIEPLVLAMRMGQNELWWASRALAQMKDLRAVEPLIALLRDKDPSVQDKAAWTLSQITGQNLGRDPDKWLLWRNQNKNPKP